jgi:hypothetical protein
MPTKANRPIVVLSTPTLESQYESVERVSSSGRPLATPMRRTNRIRRLR